MEGGSEGDREREGERGRDGESLCGVVVLVEGAEVGDVAREGALLEEGARREEGELAGDEGLVVRPIAIILDQLVRDLQHPV